MSALETISLTEPPFHGLEPEVNTGLPRILIVDDHLVVRRGLRSILEAQPGWTVVGEAENGLEAVEMAEALHPDVIVMDIAMPMMNGIEATRRIKAVSPRTAVLVFTMVDSEELVRDVLAAGARGYLLKSDADRMIVTAIESLAAGRPFLSAVAAERVLEAYLRGPGPNAAPPEPLTPREREVTQAIAEGLTNKEIARRLGISVKTVETHRATLMRKIGARSAVDVARYAARNNITVNQGQGGGRGK
jgi:DNA-binding NarL/FixJ family response regulator